MFYKTCLFFLLTIFLLTQSTSCKKEAIDTLLPVDSMATSFNHFTANFYCQKKNSYGYSSWGQSISQTDTSDIVISIRVSNDTIRVESIYFDYFIIDSVDQTYFSYEPTPYNPNDPPSYRTTLKFFNNYDSVVIEYENLAYLTGAGGGGGEVFYGAKSQLEPSSIPHAYIATLEGNYLLEVEQKRYQTGVDTQYHATLLVQQPSYSLSIDTSEFSIGKFHSWSNYYKYHTYGNIDYEENYSIYWANDSLYFESNIIYFPNSSHGVDTVFYRFKGVKQ